MIRKYRGKSYHGDEFEIIFLDELHYLCPVCGTPMMGVPPLHNGEFDHDGRFDAGREVHEVPTASFSICTLCRTEFGLYDCVCDFPGLTQMQVWKHFRLEWLARTGHRESDARQVREAFGE